MTDDDREVVRSDLAKAQRTYDVTVADLQAKRAAKEAKKRAKLAAARRCFLWSHNMVQVDDGIVGKVLVVRYECPCGKYYWLSDRLGVTRFETRGQRFQP